MATRSPKERWMKLLEESSGTGRLLQQGRHITLLLCLLHRVVQEHLDARIGFEILVYILDRLFPRDAQILAEPKGADAVDNTKIDRLGVAPLERRHLLKAERGTPGKP